MAGRNDRCPCGSGKKYKRCCGSARQAEGASTERDHGRLVEAVTGWAEREFPGELRAALLEFVGERRKITEDEENWAAAWFLHDRELPGGGTPLERYAGPDRIRICTARKIASRGWSIASPPRLGGRA